MAKLEVIGKSRKGEADKFIKPLDKIISKTDKILEKFDDDTNKLYYIASLNLLSRPLTLFGKEVKSFSSSEQIKIPKEMYLQLKGKSYFKNEVTKEDEEGNKLIGVEYIENELCLHRHDEIDKLFISEEPTLELTTEPESVSPIIQIKKEREPSKYQKAIFDYITMLVNNDKRATQKHVVVEAVAGSGKTWTIEQATKLIPTNKTVCFLAFNVHIKNELAQRAPKHVRAMTLNGAGYESLRYALRTNGKNISTVDTKNVSNILDSLFKNKYKHFTLDDIDSIRTPVIRLVSLYKATNLPINHDSLEYLSDRYNITTESNSDDIISLCKDVLDINYNILTNNWYGIDFDDQIWLPVVKNLPITKYDFVFVDETQDLNTTQLELCIKLCKTNGSIIAVGDRNQSIYGFRGADVDAIPRIIERLNAKVFPLSITYRCPKSHVELAKTLVPEIEYATKENANYEAIEGEILTITSDKIIDYVQPKDKVICRNNAPLVHPCFELIRKGKNATILGREIGEGLINLMKEIKGSDIDDFMFRLNRWYNRKKEKLEEQHKSIDKITDQYETLQVLSEDCDTIECIIAKIKTIFSDDKSAIIFSTIHKAKGLEAETVDNSIFVIKSHKGMPLMPSPYAAKDWELTQEKNLMYVAYTRAKNKMYFVD